MFAITGITGRVGGETALNLLAANQPVRAVVRDARKAEVWVERGCEVAFSDIDDLASLTPAFEGAEAVFVLLPSIFDPKPGFSEIRATSAALMRALTAARPSRVVLLSTIGAHAVQPNLLTQLGIMEQILGDLPMPTTFLRAAWFMENSSYDIAPARENGIVPSFLQPLDKPVPMVATADIGRVAAGLLQEKWTGRRVVELEGPRRITPNEIGAVFSKLLGHPVSMYAVPRATWEKLFLSQGMVNPEPRMRMIDGFNEGWIEFEGGEKSSLKGDIDFGMVLKKLIGGFA